MVAHGMRGKSATGDVHRQVPKISDHKVPEIILVGLNHETAPVELRECLAFSVDETADALHLFHHHPDISESVLISTCNRVEILMVSSNGSRAVEAAKLHLSEIKNVQVSIFDDSLYVFTGEQAIRHIFRVASSLDSMVVGEPQILGQIKDAYRVATLNHTSGAILNRLLHRSFFVAKRIRTETGIGDHAVSISYAAIELGRKIFGTLSDKAVLLIGAGEMAELAVEHLIHHRVKHIIVANRTFEHGVELAERFQGKAVRFEEISDCLGHVDIIISSTGARDFVVRRSQVKGCMRVRKNRPLFFIDIAVPRNIEPGVNRLSNCYVYDIDDLKSVVSDNMEDRKREAIKAERIVDEAVIAFNRWYENLAVVPTIVAIRQKYEQIARKEAEKTLKSLSHFSDQDREAIMKMAGALVNKFLHEPTAFMKKAASDKNRHHHIDLARRLFNMDEK